MRRFFLPIEENKHAPYALGARTFILFLLIGLVLLELPLQLRTLPFASLIGFQTPFSSRDVIAGINKSRRDANLSELKENEILSRAALAKAEDMLSRQYFAHDTPDGKAPWIFLENERYDYRAAGENLALDFENADSEHAALMASPTHRANILNSTYTEVGIAVEQGTFRGRSTILVVQFFGTPTVATVETAAIRTPAPTSPPASTRAPQSPTSAPTPTKLPEIVSEDASPEPESHAPAAPIREQTPVMPEFFSVNYPLVEESAMRIGSGIVVASILLPLTLLGMRRNSIRTGMAIRALLLLLLFGYIMGWREPHLSTTQITTRAAAYQPSMIQ